MWPFKWKLSACTYTWYYLFFKILQNEIWKSGWNLAKFDSERVKGDPERVRISLHNDANFYRCWYGGGMNLPPPYKHLHQFSTAWVHVHVHSQNSSKKEEKMFVKRLIVSLTLKNWATGTSTIATSLRFMTPGSSPCRKQKTKQN